MSREVIGREEQLRREIDEITAATAAFEAAAGDLLKDKSVVPSNERAREEVIELLGVDYVGPEMLGRLLYRDENKFQQVELDYVKLKEILNEPDEWESRKKKFETYALVFKPPISFLELRDRARANDAAKALGKTPAFASQDWINGRDWYADEAFAIQVPKSGSWELVRRGTVPGSTFKRFDDQKELIAGNQNLAPSSFPALAALLVGQYLAHDIRLYNGKRHYGRTATWTAASGGPVDLGGLGADGASVGAYDGPDVNVGLAVSRNIDCFSEVFAGMKLRQGF